jgi:hypothetical protein
MIDEKDVVVTCDAQASVKTAVNIGEIELGRAKYLTIFGEWRAGRQGWPWYGPIGNGNGIIGNSYAALVEVWLVKGKEEPELLLKKLYQGSPMHIMNGYGKKIKVTVRMDDPGDLTDNEINPNNPMRATLIEFK